ncbi:MAG: nucleotide exchange factor GrpE, partial [Clostridia bacterium]|nr:nucleotide exchange factor GrpE [Clostridia bacterium]
KKKQKKLEKELEELKKSLEAKENELKEANSKYLTMLAEYDNFRRRSAKEKESTYSDAYCDVLSQILPVIDNLERAAAFSSDNPENVAKGLDMTLRSFSEILEKLGVKETESLGKTFDPNVHNAVMHTENEELGEQEICEVLQKGYMMGDKVLRYAMVKVAN